MQGCSKFRARSVLAEAGDRRQQARLLKGLAGIQPELKGGGKSHSQVHLHDTGGFSGSESPSNIRGSEVLHSFSAHDIRVSLTNDVVT